MPGPIFFVVMAAKMYLAAHAIIAFFVISGLTTVVSYGLGKLAQVLTRKPAGGQATAERAGMQVTRRGSAEPRRLVYGRVRAGGVFSFFHVGGTAGEYLYTVISLSGRKLTKIGIDNTGGSEFMYFDGVAVPLVASGAGYVPSAGAFVDHVYVETNLGDADQTALGQTLTDYTFKALWTSAHRQRGCAHALLRLKYNDAVFTNGLPNITFDLKGAAVYDPREGGQVQADPSTWAYSANPSLIAADFLTDVNFGHGAAYARLNETALIAAAGICDYSVALDTSPPSSEPRYEFNGVILTSQKPGEILLDMSNSMAGYIVGVVGGLWMIYAGAWRAPAITLTESDIISPIRMVSKVSRRELINAVKGTYLGDLTQWQPSDFPPVTNATYLTEDGGDQLWADVTLPYTTSVTMAQRLAKIQLERSRRQKTLEFTAKLGAYRLQPADTVYVTNTRLGFSAKTFEVTESRLTVEDSGGAPALGVALTLREADAAIYAWSSAEEGEIATPATPTLPGGTGPPSPVTGQSASEGPAVSEDGHTVSRVTVAFTPPVPLDNWGCVRIWVSGLDGPVGTPTENPRLVAELIESPADWQWETPDPPEWIRLYFVSVGMGGEMADVLTSPTAEVLLDGQTSAPVPVSSFAGVADGQQVRLSWRENLEGDMDHYDIARRDSAGPPAESEIISRVIAAGSYTAP